ncbi:liver carboxylesterase 2, partial [Larimichthys crocea]|uniref:liver carboxylesterase 2 n=1 Tax=Larimichthys crocea TaxID=215358 RepID=UPI000F5D5D6F
QASGANELILNEYLQQNDSPENIRDVFTEILGDLVLVLPILKVSTYHRGEPTSYIVFRSLLLFSSWEVLKLEVLVFISQAVKVFLCVRVSFLHRSPNKPGLVERPLYNHDERFLKLNLQQTVGRGLKQKRVHFLDVMPAKSHPANDEL